MKPGSPARAALGWLPVTFACLLSLATGPGASLARERPLDRGSGGGRGPKAEAPAVPREPEVPSDAQSMRIDVRGAIAHVVVTRAMPCEGERRQLGGLLGSSAADAVLDVALPDGAALLDVEIDDGGRFVPAKVAGSTSHDTYVEALRAMGFSPTRAVFPDESAFRVRVACSRSNRNHSKTIRYSFSVPLEIVAGVPRLTFPASADLNAPRTRVQVTVRPANDLHEISIAGARHAVQPGAEATAVESVGVRARWVVTLPPAPTRTGEGSAGPAPTRMVARASSARERGAAGDALLAWSIGAGAAAAQPLPERVLFLIDRSRSVGPGGFEAERNLARTILELLPPATRFDALLFDRTQKRLFPVARPATRAAIGALEDELVPAQLTNGTDLAAALRAAGELLRREAADFGPRALLVVLSDGAIGRAAGGAPLGPLLGDVPGVELMITALSVRLNDDPPPSADERRALRGLCAGAILGGVERSLRVPEVLDGTTVRGILDTLRTGGDVHAIGVAASGGNVEAARRGRRLTLPLVEVLAPGQGARGVVPLPRGISPSAPLPVGSAARGRSEARPVTVRPVAVDARWLAPLARPAAPEERLLVSPAVAAMVEPARPAAEATAEESLPRGYMERSVVRDALSLAYTPRARACYLNRSARTPAERDLAGRVRLALDLVRGEVGGARVESSTLGHPAIEACLREAAFAIEVPRAYRNDEAVTAVLNLVFRPRTPDRRTPGLQESTGRELDLLVEAALKAEAIDAGAPVTAPPDAGAADAH